MPTPIRQPSDGDSKFGLGMKSSGKPDKVVPGAYYRAFNTVCRGGRISCRPGFKWRLNLPDGKLQGLTLFRPASGAEQLIFVVSGRVYVSGAPFDTYEQIPGIQLSADSDQVWWAHTERAVQRNADLSLTLITPRAMLLIQDGLSAPAYWDGATGQQILGQYATPQGTAMAWSGGRLWVARNRSLFASDYADPLTFFEGEYIGTTNSFVLPGNVRGLAEAPNVQSPVLLAYTADATVQFLSGIRTRSLWTSTANFQATVLPQMGCLSHRSIVQAHGQLYWFSPMGLTRLDVAQQGYVEGRQRVIDTDMAVSKYRVDPDVSLIAGTGFESYLLMSVPSGSTENIHTWCLDLSSLDGSITEDGLVRGAWASYWTGTRPVEWAVGTVMNEPRCFFVSHDYDGYNRLWEAFSTERNDNGCPISWGFETRSYRGRGTAPKVWRNGEITLSDVEGEVDVAVASAGTKRGRWKRICTKRVSAAVGTVGFKEQIADDEDLYAFKGQSRIVATVDDRLETPDSLSSCCLDDANREEHIDVDFQLCVLVSGAASVDMVRVWFDEETEFVTAACEEDETPERAERFDGASFCGTADVVKAALDAELTVFDGNSTAIQTHDGVTVTGSASAVTTISQGTADKIAACVAQMRAAQKLLEQAPPTLGGFLATCIPSE